MADRSESKGWTCWYWKNQNSCKYSDEACRYSHTETGNDAPRPSSFASSSIAKIANHQWRSMPDEIPDASSPTPENLVFIKGEKRDTSSHVERSSILSIPRTLPQRFTHGAKPNDLLGKPLSSETISWALQQSYSYNHFKSFFAIHEAAEVQKAIKGTVNGLPTMFSVVQNNSADTTRLLIENGGDPNVRAEHSDIPLLTLAVIKADENSINTTELVKTLLALGADPMVIPEEMWRVYMKAPEDTTGTRTIPTPTAALWYGSIYREALIRTLNLTQRYFLSKAAAIGRPSPRTIEIAKLHNMTALLQAPHHLIGQDFATTLAFERIIHHVAFGDKEPLVMVFAGPSGHGKTKLAMDMKFLLSIEHILVDCTEIRHETDIFGPKAPHEGYEEGSPLNNHLYRESRRRNIVLLDEFEKSTQELWAALLSVVEGGVYRDRRSHAVIDCSQTIWILATNRGESIISAFYTEHLADRPKSVQEQAPWKILDRHIRKDFAGAFGNYITGRFSAIIPFMPFSTDEAAVVAHKFALALKDQLRKPIDLENRHSVGHVCLDIKRDGELCAYMAKEGYDMQFGARSLKRMVKETIQGRVLRDYCGKQELIKNDDNEGPLKRYVAEFRPIKGDKIAVFGVEDTKKAASVNSTDS